MRRLSTPGFVSALAVVLAVTTVPGPALAQTGTLVVVNKSASTVTLIDLASQRIVATLPTGQGPHEIAITRDGRAAVVTDYARGNSLTVIDVAARSVARTVDLSSHPSPHGIAFLPGDSVVAVTSEASNSVVLVRVRDGQIIRAISTDQGGSHMLAVPGSGQWIYTGNIRDNTVSELDVSKGALTRTFPVPTQPEAITVTADGSEVWVGSNDQGSVSAVSTKTGEVRTMLRGFGWPYRILITPDNRLVLVPDLRKHQLRFAERATGRELAVLDFPDAGPQGVTLSPDGRTVYLSLSQEDRLAVIDLERREVTGYIAAGPRPDGIAYSALVTDSR